MINAEELVICRRRSHNPEAGFGMGGWVQCVSCGMWLREVTTIEEREDEPPESELSLLARARKLDGEKPPQ
jgi:hypothetical protein